MQAHFNSEGLRNIKGKYLKAMTNFPKNVAFCVLPLNTSWLLGATCTDWVAGGPVVCHCQEEP